MRKDQSRFKNSVTAIMFVLAVIFTFAQASSTQTAVFAGTVLDENVPAKVDPVIDSQFLGYQW